MTTFAAFMPVQLTRAGALARTLDNTLLVCVLALVTIGLVMIASASVSFAEHQYGDTFYFLKRHLMYLALGIAGGLVVLNIPLSFWYRYGLLLLTGTFLLLVIVLIPGVGRRVNGSQRWLALGPITIQASEVAKLAVVIFMAGYLERHQTVLQESWQGFFKPVAILGVLLGLLLLEPDFGSSVVLAGTVLSMLFFAGVKIRQFSLLIVIGLGGLAAMALLSPYRMQRLVTYLDPWADQFNSGYQLTQSLIAFGRGEWFGVGLGNSIQKLFYLPEAHTDFVFAIFAEEFGLLGVLAVLALFTVLLWRVFGIVRNAVSQRDWFSAYTAFGIGILIAGQTFINMGVTSGLLPTKGLTLPFISYGGSSLLVCCAMVALLLRIDMELKGNLPGKHLVSKSANRGSVRKGSNERNR